ncbi:ECF transporter S component [Spiroplasma endosymbiont of Cantharis nigra]|uniref:ECF transporter S component n=1 Tax=Spiroplasma endosymbiont of Cantharis nigra TaxID=3066278 RepID=UPI0030CC2A23
MENTYNFWSHKYDFAEINRYNWRMVLKDNFVLDIKRISLLAMLFAIEILFTIISKYTIGGLAIAEAFTIEISLIGILFIYLTTNVFYAAIFNIAANSLRMVLPLPSNYIGVLAMTISDLTFIISFAIIFFSLKKIVLFKIKKENQLKWYLLLIAISGTLAIMISAFISLICNQHFIFEWYEVLYPGIVPEKNSYGWNILLWTGFGVSIAKLGVNLIIFLLTTKLLVKLINKHLF